MFRPLALAMLAALSLLVAVGCGGSDSPSSTEPVVASTNQRFSKSELIAQGDAICKASREQVAPLISEIEEAQRHPVSADDLNELARLIRQGEGETWEEISQLRSLAPPSSDEPVIDSWLSKLETAVRQDRQIADSFERHDHAEAEHQSWQAETESEAAHKIARGYGFKVCDTKG